MGLDVSTLDLKFFLVGVDPADVEQRSVLMLVNDIINAAVDEREAMKTLHDLVQTAAESCPVDYSGYVTLAISAVLLTAVVVVGGREVLVLLRVVIGYAGYCVRGVRHAARWVGSGYYRRDYAPLTAELVPQHVPGPLQPEVAVGQLVPVDVADLGFDGEDEDGESRVEALAAALEILSLLPSVTVFGPSGQ